MKRIWTRADHDRLRADMRSHPAYLAAHQDDLDAPPFVQRLLTEPEPAQLAPVIDLRTREVIA